METVWVLVINNEYGNSIQASHSEEIVNDILLAYVVEWWDAEITSESIPDDPKEAILQYFDYVEYESYSLELVTVS